MTELKAIDPRQEKIVSDEATNVAPNVAATVEAVFGCGQNRAQRAASGFAGTNGVTDRSVG